MILDHAVVSLFCMTSLLFFHWLWKLLVQGSELLLFMKGVHSLASWKNLCIYVCMREGGRTRVSMNTHTHAFVRVYFYTQGVFPKGYFLQEHKRSTYIYF